MSQVITGLLSDALGAAHSDGRFWACPSGKFRPMQRASIPLEAGHGGPRIGQVEDLSLSRDGKLWVTAEVDDGWDLSRYGPWQLSYQLVERRDGWYDLEAVAVVETSATVGTCDIDVVDGRLWEAAVHKRGDSRHTRNLIENAYNTQKARRFGQPIEIRGTIAAPAPVYGRATSTRQIETRSAEVTDVDFPGRIATIIAAPFGSVAVVAHRGTVVEEVFDRTAWLGVNEQSNRSRIRVWMNHRPENVIGRITELDPLHPVGLIAEFKVTQTPEGDSALAMLSDDLLDASVGFRSVEERWEGDRRHVVTAHLHHLGLTSDPAYNGTHVVGMRGVGAY